jgi:hypothetical protein
MAAEPLPPDPPDWSSVLAHHGSGLAAVDSDAAAKELFVSTIGPTLHLADAAGTIGAKGLPAKLAKDLLLPDVIRSAQRLIASLVAWRLAEQSTQILERPAHETFPSLSFSGQLEWLKMNGPFPSLQKLISPPSSGDAQAADDPTARAIMAGRTSMEASQQAMSEWFWLRSWKDRVRSLRGQARLCGTWQWVIHNHQQHHQERKLSIVFPPSGFAGTGIPGLSEAMVLGDTVYLRWETEGRTQEDSLLFSKEGQRLEGTFINSQGGWGSISGKRTATCTP